MEGLLIRRWDPIVSGWRLLYEHQVEVSTPCGSLSTRRPRFRPRFVGVEDAWRDFRSGETVSPPGGAGSTNCSLGFPHRAGGYRPGNHHFLPRFVGVVEVWKYF